MKAVFIEANILLFGFIVGVLSLPLLLVYALSEDGVSVFPPLFSITFLLLSAKLPITFVLFATSTTELFTNKIVTIAAAERMAVSQTAALTCFFLLVLAVVIGASMGLFGAFSPSSKDGICFKISSNSPWGGVVS